jgi:4-amino-4-deoxy-L-arabinose transferase-like glycosyltransferase
VRRLPRLALILFCVAYVLPGFIGREPWKSADVSAFGVMLEMAAGRTGWWNPQILGLAADEAGPLPYWLGALFIWLLPFVPADFAARVPFGLLLALALVATWHTVYRLARQPAAQPVSFAFGGEAHPTDYARAMADAGLLALIACLGLAQLSHETTPDLARLAMVSCLLYAGSRLAHASDVRQPVLTVALLGLATLALIFSGAPWIALWLGSGLLLAVFVSRVRSGNRGGDSVDLSIRTLATDPLAWAAGVLAVVLGGSAVAGLFPPPGWQTAWSSMPWGSWGRLLLWFTWPVWPLALWTLWRWRRQLLQPHVALPLWAALVSVIDSAQSDERDRALLLALPALAALAAFALPTLRRSVSALIDWFTLLFFTACALVIWVVWFAMQTGVPAKPAANVARLAPGSEREQPVVNLDPVERRQPQAGQGRHQLQDAFDQVPERRRTGQIGAIAGQIDSGQNDLVMSGIDQSRDPFNHRAPWHRPAVATPERNRAEGAAVVAAVLHLDQCAGVAAETPVRFERSREIGARNSFLDCARNGRMWVGPVPCGQFVQIPDHPRHFRHRRKCIRVDRRRASRHDQFRQRPRASRFPDRGACRAHGLVGHRTAVDDHDVAIAQLLADIFALCDVEAAPERNHFGR